MTDRMPALEWAQDDDNEWFASCGDFGLHAYRAIDFVGRGGYGWRVSTPNSADAGDQGREPTLLAAQLAAESWLAEAVREPAERLGGGGGEREEIR